jgi:hypothetical protein
LPPEALTQALAASIYPPALAAVIALGRGPDVRLRVVLLVASAFATTFIVGTLILELFGAVGVTSRQVGQPSAGLYIAGGVVLLYVAARLGRRHPRPPTRSTGHSRTDRYLQSRRLVALLGVVLYILPSPIYVLAIKPIADTNAPSAEQLAYLAVVVLVMLWIIELPMLALLAFPKRGPAVLEAINGWIARHWRTLAMMIALVLGAYLVAVGLVELLS